MSRLPHPELSEAERFPLLTPDGRRFLHAMRQDPQAPIWHWPNGEQLDAAGLARVEQFAVALAEAKPTSPGALPVWLDDFVTFCLTEVPFYRARSRSGTRFVDVPSCCRGDLAPQPWEFVPDSVPLDRLVVFSSSGTTGHPAQLPTHPATAACGIPLLEHALAPLGIALPRGVDRVAISNITAYRGAYSTAIVCAWLREAGCVRVNLRPEDWRTGGDCAAYLNRLAAPVVLGDPLSFAALADLDLRQPPRALLSSITGLSSGFAAELSAHFGCPVVDLYALTEAGIVAVGTRRGHVVLAPDLYVEILDDHDQPCPPGVRGEVTLTGGRNPYGPLLRYRTGDFAAMDEQDHRPLLVGLEGRQAVLFPTSDGRLVHSMEISRALRPLAIVQFRLHQDADGGVHFAWCGRATADEITDALRSVLGPGTSLALDPLSRLELPGRKLREYRTDMSVPLLERLRAGV